ncbi:MAG: isopentenyl-diphosphate Delta-isomerase [Bacteroidia bacterium]
MKKQELLILVDDNDQPIGKLEKSEVHQSGLLHRAFSVFIFNSKGELLLQQRADEKYHSAGLWSNTCCSHPHFGEKITDAVNKRLKEEMGMSCKVEFAFSFIYKAKFDNGLTEYEFDHVFWGVTDETPKPEKTEVQNWKYMDFANLEKDIKLNAQDYTVWLSLCFKEVALHLKEFIPYKTS